MALLTALTLVWAGALVLSIWADLAGAEREAALGLLRPRAGLVLLLVIVLPLLLWAAARPWVARWPRAAERLREEVAIVAAAHAGHRITVAGAREMRELAGAIDTLAQSHAALQRDVEQRIGQARAALAEETLRLAALMSELTLGVLVCNREGRVLLYNARAAALLGDGGAEGAAGQGGAPIGLGRGIGSLLDAAAVDHAWQQVQRRLETDPAHAVAHFVAARSARAAATGAGGAAASAAALLRVQMVPTRGEQGTPVGYVLLIDDITRSVAEQGRRDALLQRLTEGMRSTLANLRAAAQALQQYPAMDAQRRTSLTGVVHEEAERLAGQLHEALREPAASHAGGWLLEDVQAGDLADALQRNLSAEPGLVFRFEGARGLWLVLDSHAIVRLLANLARRLAAEVGARDLVLSVVNEPPAARIDLAWTGEPLPPGRLGEWESAAAGLGAAQGADDSDIPAASPRAVLDRHGAELWSQADEGDSHRHRLCLQLGAARRTALPELGLPARAGGRPIAYDFDLFNQAGQNAALDETALASLTYTVFDAETTGLRPSEGDEIIAIGAVRIVNARLLEDEYFDRRVRPRRAVRASAQAVHGISTESLAAEPPLEQVLPPFARFCAETVLVAHNAAFDMRFLELARERTGVRFDQPVLDTLLLSAALHPGHGSAEHHLEQIAARLGVPVAGRHQALGDAITTGRVLLKLLPLLAERGIVTLGQAREASRRVAQAGESF